MPTYGDSGTGGGQGSIADPYTLAGTQISALGSPMTALAARCHTKSMGIGSAGIDTTLVELWLNRDNAWLLCPLQPLTEESTHPVLSRRLKEPASLEFTLVDQDGILYWSNLRSGANYNNAGVRDPLLNEARQMLLRIGTRCFYDIAYGIVPTATFAGSGAGTGSDIFTQGLSSGGVLTQGYFETSSGATTPAPPSSGQLSYLTDGLITTWNAAPAAYCAWAFTQTGTGADIVTQGLSSGGELSQGFFDTGVLPLIITLDLGSVQQVKHIAVRFGDTPGIATLPASVQAQLSVDNSLWYAYPARPVGGPIGDWQDAAASDPKDPDVTEVFLCDLERPARFVQLVITPTGAQTIALDEIAVYGGGASSFLGANKFTGYLGDSIRYAADGTITATATDTQRRLADNNRIRLTNQYGNMDVADIAWALLTNTGYWPGASGSYSGVWPSSSLNWTQGTAFTGLTMPIWQGEGNSMAGYEYDLWHEVGWILESDGNGYLTPREPVYRQYRPDRVLINAPDGNQDVRACERDLTGKNLRNSVTIETGRPSTGVGGGIDLYDPASVAEYGFRTNIISDPLAVTTDLQNKLAAAILRDYAWNLHTLTCEISPDYDTHIWSIHAMRTALRPHLAANNCTAQGQEALQELWRLTQIEEHFTASRWWGQCTYSSYVPAALAPPTMVELLPASAADSFGFWDFTLFWSDSDPGLASYNIYVSTTSATAGFSLYVSGVAANQTGWVINGFSLGQQIWVVMTAVDVSGRESVPSVILSALAGGAAQNESNWSVTDLSAAFASGIPASQNGQSGVTYYFTFLFSSPPIPAPTPDNGQYGLRHFKIGMAAGALPSNPTDYHSWDLIYQSGKIERVPPGQVGSGANVLAKPFTPGQIPWGQHVFVAGGFASGTVIYLRIFTGNATNYPSHWYASNVVTVTIP